MPQFVYIYICSNGACAVGEAWFEFAKNIITSAVKHAQVLQTKHCMGVHALLA